MSKLQAYYDARKALENAETRTAGIDAATEWATTSTTIALRYREVIARGLALVGSEHANTVNAARAIVTEMEASLS